MEKIKSLSSLVLLCIGLVIPFTGNGQTSTPINILNAQYTTGVYAYPHVNGAPSDTYPFGTPLFDPITRTQFSTEPISDSLSVPPPYTTTTAYVNANVLAVSAFTIGIYLLYGNGHADAYAESDIWFSPVTSGTANINVQSTAFGAISTWSWTCGNFSLTDVSTGDVLWNYGWNTGISLENLETIFGMPTKMSGTSILNGGGGYGVPSPLVTELDTYLNTSDVYELILQTGSDAASDSESESINLTGLEPVPEPSTSALIGLGLLAFAMKFKLRSPSAFS